MTSIRTALRSLLRRPLHTGMATVTLALGLAVAVGVFAYANAFRQPFPGADSRGLVRVFDAADEDPFGDVSYLDYVDLARGAADVFDGLGAIRDGYAASIRHEESTEVVFLEAVSGSAFQVLDVAMAAGRPLMPDDDLPGAEPVAVISWSWWQRQWNGDPSVLGSVVHFNFRPHVVVGVTAPGFRGSLASSRPEAWLPFEPFRARYTSFDQAALDRDQPLVRVYGRLREGVSPRLAAERLSALTAGLDDTHPRSVERGPRSAVVAPATWIDPRARLAEAGTVRMMLVAAVGLLLLVCANVGNLLVAVAAGRRREMALRAALGASRGTLVAQVLLESALLAGAAGAAALLVAGPVAGRLGSYFARPSVWGANVAREITVDLDVVLAALTASFLAALVAGLVPAFSAGRGDVAETLKTGSADGEAAPRIVAGRSVPSVRDVLVAAQVGLALLLLVVAGLTLRTLDNVASLDTGLDHPHLLASYVSTSSTGVTVEERALWFRTLTERLAEEPWVRAATISQQAPLAFHPAASFRPESAQEDARVVFATVVPGYFETLGVPLVAGRDVSLADTLGAPDVAVVSEAFVRRWFPEGNAVGRSILRSGADGAGERSYEVVGVARDARIRDYLADPEPVVYLSNGQHGYASGAALTVATNEDPAVATPMLRRWLRDYESHIAIVNIQPYEDVVRGFTYVQRMNAQMFSVLAALGLVLGVVGVFAVMSLSVSRRTREIGVRMAVGARPADIGRHVLWRAFAPVALGLAAGAGASLLISGLLRSLVVGVDPADPWSLVGAAVLFAATALIAMAVPARRAVAVEPARSLRAE